MWLLKGRNMVNLNIWLLMLIGAFVIFVPNPERTEAYVEVVGSMSIILGMLITAIFGGGLVKSRYGNRNNNDPNDEGDPNEKV